MGRGARSGGGVVAVLHLTGKVGVDIVGVHPGARLGIGGGMADGEAVFDDVLAVLDGLHGHFMALGYILQRGDGKAVYLHQSALGDGMQRDNDVVDGADVNCLRHSFSPCTLKSTKGLLPKAAAL